MLSERRAGAALSLAASVLSALLALLTTPVIVRGLGVEGFGAYSMALALVAVFMLFDAGLTDALVRFVVLRRREGTQALERYLHGALALYLVGLAGLGAVGALALAAATFAGGALSPALLALSLLAAGATILGNPFKAALVAAERFMAVRLAEIAAALATAALTVLAARAGLGPVAVFAAVVTGLVALSAARIACARALLGLSPGLAPMAAADRRALRRYATPILGGAAVEALTWRAGTLLVGVMMGPAAVATYAVALLFQKHLLRLSAALSRVMVPAIIRAVDGGEGPQALAATLARVARAQALLLGAVMIALAAFGDTFLSLWLGPGFEAAYGLMLVVLVPFCLDQVGSLRNVVLQARALYGVKARQALVLGLAGLGATAALVPFGGLWGAAGTTAACLACGLLLANRLLGKRGGVDVAHFYRLVLRDAGPALLALAVSAATVDQLPIAGWGGLAARGLLYVVAFVLVLWSLATSAAERAACRRLLGAALARWRPGRRPLVDPLRPR